MTLTEKIRQYNGKISAIAFGLALTAGINYFGIHNATRNLKTETDCEIYRGHRANRDGKILISNNYFFDKKEVNERDFGARVVLEGDLKWVNMLERGKKYCFVFEEGRWPWSSKKLISAWPDYTDSVVSQNQNSK